MPSPAAKTRPPSHGNGQGPIYAPSLVELVFPEKFSIMGRVGSHQKVLSVIARVALPGDKDPSTSHVWFA